MAGKPTWDTEFPLGLTIRLVRSYDASLGKMITRFGRMCECGQPYGGIQIKPMALPLEYDADQGCGRTTCAICEAYFDHL